MPGLPLPPLLDSRVLDRMEVACLDDDIGGPDVAWPQAAELVAEMLRDAVAAYRGTGAGYLRGVYEAAGEHWPRSSELLLAVLDAQVSGWDAGRLP